MLATDYSLGLTVRIATPEAQTGVCYRVIPSCEPAYDAAHHTRLIQFHTRVIRRELKNPKARRSVRRSLSTAKAKTDISEPNVKAGCSARELWFDKPVMD